MYKELISKMESHTNQFDNLGFHVEVAGTFKHCAEAMKKYIVDNNLMREQIISITGHETSLDDPDTELVLFFRKDSDPTMSSAEKIDFHVVVEPKEWAAVDILVKNFASKKGDIVAITGSPRNMGDMNSSIIWFMPGVSSEPLNSKIFTRIGDDWPGVFKDACDWLNYHVRPHRFMGCQAHEAKHPNPSKELMVTVYFKGLPEEDMTLPEDVKQPLYECEYIEGEDGWDSLMNKQAEIIESKGVKESYMFVASVNKSETDGQASGLIYWDKAKEEALDDVSRGGGCCVIF